MAAMRAYLILAFPAALLAGCYSTPYVTRSVAVESGQQVLRNPGQTVLVSRKNVLIGLALNGENHVGQAFELMVRNTSSANVDVSTDNLYVTFEGQQCYVPSLAEVESRYQSGNGGIGLVSLRALLPFTSTKPVSSGLGNPHGPIPGPEEDLKYSPQVEKNYMKPLTVGPGQLYRGEFWIEHCAEGTGTWDFVVTLAGDQHHLQMVREHSGG